MADQAVPEKKPRDRLAAMCDDVSEVLKELRQSEDEAAWLYRLAGTLLKHAAPGLRLVTPQYGGAPIPEHPNGHVARLLGSRGTSQKWLLRLQAAAE
jgi:hypothetical protein